MQLIATVVLPLKRRPSLLTLSRARIAILNAALASFSTVIAASLVIALDAVKRTEADASMITTFNNQHQRLQTQTSELDAIVKKTIVDNEILRLAEIWKMPDSARFEADY
jgi:hypothetical protein